MERLQKQSEEAQSNAAEATMLYDSAKVELERALPLETEVKEKNLLIGKLRHEAVILNDHLTKALKYLKKGKPEDNIDKLVEACSSVKQRLLNDTGNSFQTTSFTLLPWIEQIQKNSRFCK